MNTWVEQVGNWNPQLLREWRGRLKVRTILATLGLSAVLQFLAVLMNPSYSPIQSPSVDWADLFETLTWLGIPYLFLAWGSFLLIQDFTQEAKRETFNFIRMSPRSGFQILWGKILGVPILPWIALLSVIPLHVITTVQVDGSLSFLVSYYSLLAAMSFLWFSCVSFFTISGSKRYPATAFLLVGVVASILITPLILIWLTELVWQPCFPNLNFNYDRYGSHYEWFFFPITSHGWGAHGFQLFQIGIGLKFVWHALLRIYRNPTTTSLSKPLSYGLVAYTQVFLLGFMTQSDLVGQATFHPEDINIIIYLIDGALSLSLILMLCPGRQLLMDWTRYDRSRGQHWSDLIWGDKSPAPVAMGLNMGLIYLFLMPWLWILFGGDYLAHSLLLLPLGGLVILYSLVYQRIVASNLRHADAWAIGTLIGLLLLPILGLVSLQINPNQEALPWTLLLGVPLDYQDTMSAEFMIGIGLQWLLIALLACSLNQHLKTMAQTARSSGQFFSPKS